MYKSLASGLLALTISLPSWALPIEMEATPLRDFVRWYSEETGQSVAVSPDISGELTVYADDVPREQLPAFFDGVLRSHGFQLLDGNPATIIAVAPGDFMAAVETAQSVEPLASRVLSLDNVRASDIAPVIGAYLSSASAPGVRYVEPQVLSSSNSLLISATEAQLADLEQLLPQFDIPNPQVLIQAVIFETSAGDTFDLGVAFGSSSGVGGSDVAGGFNTNALGTSLSMAGASFGIFDGNALALAVQAIRRDTSAKVLSTPQILTLSGKPGRISVGQNVPFVTGSVASATDDVLQTIEREDVGVSLEVLPVVLSSGLIVMDVQTEADSLADSIQAADIITNQRSINTTVQLRSGQSLLLGGLTSEDMQEVDTSVPGLSSIPVVGALFRSTSTQSQQRKLHVMLHATVLGAI